MGEAAQRHEVPTSVGKLCWWAFWYCSAVVQQYCDIILRKDMHMRGCRCQMVLLLQGDGIIVVGFRGTASLANVLADLKVRWKGFL